MKNPKILQKIIRGFANHRRIQILSLLEKSPGLTVWQIADILRVNYKTIANHIIRLESSGLISKHYRNQAVVHQLSNLGKRIIGFVKQL